jgi:hypothetical protein
MPRSNKLSDKDMSTLREADIARVQRDKCHGSLRDYSLNHTVEMRWDLSEDAKRDQIFELTIDGDIKVLLDAEQVMRLVRWV